MCGWAVAPMQSQVAHGQSLRSLVQGFVFVGCVLRNQWRGLERAIRQRECVCVCVYVVCRCPDSLPCQSTQPSYSHSLFLIALSRIAALKIEYRKSSIFKAFVSSFVSPSHSFEEQQQKERQRKSGAQEYKQPTQREKFRSLQLQRWSG